MACPSNHSSGGIGLAGVLLVVFVILKLVGVINWSWWWVTAPLWGSVALLFLVVALVLGVAAIASLLGAKLTIRRRR